MPIAWKRSVNWYANSSNTCALSPIPVSKTKVVPVPPQSRTSSCTPGSTVTKLTLCPEVSHLQALFVARSCIVEPDALDPTDVVVAFQTLRPSSAQTTRLPRMPSAIRSQTFHFPMTNVLVLKRPNDG